MSTQINTMGRYFLGYFPSKAQVKGKNEVNIRDVRFNQIETSSIWERILKRCTCDSQTAQMTRKAKKYTRSCPHRSSSSPFRSVSESNSSLRMGRIKIVDTIAKTASLKHFKRLRWTKSRSSAIFWNVSRESGDPDGLQVTKLGRARIYSDYHRTFYRNRRRRSDWYPNLKMADACKKKDTDCHEDHEDCKTVDIFEASQCGLVNNIIIIIIIIFLILFSFWQKFWSSSGIGDM